MKNRLVCLSVCLSVYPFVWLCVCVFCVHKHTNTGEFHCVIYFSWVYILDTRTNLPAQLNGFIARSGSSDRAGGHCWLAINNNGHCHRGTCHPLAHN